MKWEIFREEIGQHWFETEIKPGQFSLTKVNPYRSIMPRGKEISEGVRKRVVIEHWSGESNNNFISKRFELHRSAMRQIIYKWRALKMNFAREHLEKPEAIGSPFCGQMSPKLNCLLTYHQKNRLPAVKHGGENVKIWACFSSSGPGKLHIVQRIMNSEEYCKIIPNITSSCQLWS